MDNEREEAVLEQVDDGDHDGHGPESQVERAYELRAADCTLARTSSAGNP